MLNYIWAIMLIVGFVVGIFNGKADEVTKAVMDSAGNAVQLCIGLLAIMCLWTGMLGIAEKSGLVSSLEALVRPIIKFLFPEIPRKHKAAGAIVSNLVANFFGLGNAATPLGIKAMSELQRLNPQKDTATNSMSMFLVLNTSAIQLIPATIIALRVAGGSQNPGEIIVTIWIASICASIAGVTAVKVFSKWGRL